MKTSSQILKEMVAARKSPLAFSGKPVSESELLEIFEAGRWAASAFNEQPWRFIYGMTNNSPEAFDALLNLINPANQVWAKEASALILVAAKSTFSHNQVPNKHSWYDAGQAVGAMSLQAISMGIHLHQMGGFDFGKAAELLTDEKDVEPVAMIAMGYPGEITDLPDKLKERALKPRSRYAIEQIIRKPVVFGFTEK